ncbi:MAG TPA: hypothetical protein VGA37_17630 [Gemmatimonadales bacterium]
MTDDGTLAGYFRLHDRPPAFEGSDGRPYSVAVYVADAPDGDGRYGAALLFVQWAASGAEPSGHRETAYLTFGATPQEAEQAIGRLTLYEIKAHLDRLLAAPDAGADW